jgi:IMP dehydrogenase
MQNIAVLSFFDKMNKQGLMLTYDDVRLRTRYSDILPPDTDLRTRFSRNVSLRIPIVSSPMDTVTTAPMAIAMAEIGGLGIIHRGLSPVAQAKEVARVKNRLNARIETPITVLDKTTIEEVFRIRFLKENKFHTFPVVDDAGTVVGLLTRKDLDFCRDSSLPASKIMTPFANLTTADIDITEESAFELMHKHKKQKLLLMHKDGTLGGMYTFSDLKRILSAASDHNVDGNGQLIVGAAVGCGEGALERAELLAREKCNMFHIDTAHGDSRNVIETIERLKVLYPHVDVVAGNISGGESAKRLIEAGADGILVGQGPGSICTTRVVAGVGVPQVSAIFECQKAIEDSGVPVCADGGINNSGDIVIALAVGASSVMLGRLLAGTEESAGETRFFQGMQVKDYRGMGSLGAMRDTRSSRERYGQGERAITKVTPEGIEGIVPYRGTVHAVLEQYIGGIRAGMGYNGARTIPELRDKAELFRISPAGFNESHPHDVTITTQAPNYQGR